MDEKKESILLSIKSLLGIMEDSTTFDQDVIMFINSAFATLLDLGLGPAEGFAIHDDETTWGDYITNWNMFEDIKTYIYLRVKLTFDPPQSSSVSENYKELLKETQWRIMTRQELTGGDDNESNDG